MIRPQRGTGRLRGSGRLPGQPGQRLRHRADDLRGRRPVRPLTPGAGTPRGGPGGQRVGEQHRPDSRRPSPSAAGPAEGRPGPGGNAGTRIQDVGPVPRRSRADRQSPRRAWGSPARTRSAAACPLSPGRPHARPPRERGRGAPDEFVEKHTSCTPGTARARARTALSPWSSASWLLFQSATSGSTSKTRVFGDSSPARRSTHPGSPGDRRQVACHYSSTAGPARRHPRRRMSRRIRCTTAVVAHGMHGHKRPRRHRITAPRPS